MYQPLLQWNESRASTFISVGIRFCQIARNVRHVGPGLLDRHAGLKPPNAVDTQSRASRREQIVCPLTDRDKHFPSGRSRRKIMKACRNHADDGVDFSIKRDALPHDVPLRTELATPQAFADQRNRRGADFIFTRSKRATEKRLRTKNWEEVGRDELPRHLLGFPGSRQAERRTAPNCHCGECVVVLLPVTKIKIRDRSKFEVRLALTQ